MGEVEQLNNYFNREPKLIRGYTLSRRLDEVKREIQQGWQEYKRSRAILHGEATTDDKLDMLLIYLIKKGLLS